MAEQSYAESFNSNIKLVTRDLTRKFPSDAMAARLLKRINLAISMEPMMLIRLIGPKLYKYRDHIYSSDPAAAEFVLTHGFDEDISDSSADDAEAASHFIPMVQQYLRTAQPSEKKAYHQIVVKLLDDYIEYLSLQA